MKRILVTGGAGFIGSNFIKMVLSQNRDLMDPEYIVINKQVNIGQTLGIADGGFSPEEIKELRYPCTYNSLTG